MFARVRINAPASRRGLRFPATFQLVSSGELFKVHTGLCAEAFLTGKRRRDWLGHLDAPHAAMDRMSYQDKSPLT
jgi:hypothetical protein